MRSLRSPRRTWINQRQAVKEERRLSVDNRPYGQSGERWTNWFTTTSPNHHSVIGLHGGPGRGFRWMMCASSSGRTTRPTTRVLALAGDLDAKDAWPGCGSISGRFPGRKAPKAVDLAEPEKNAERRAKIDDKLARLTQVEIAYRIPEATKPG